MRRSSLMSRPSYLPRMWAKVSPISKTTFSRYAMRVLRRSVLLRGMVAFGRFNTLS